MTAKGLKPFPRWKESQGQQPYWWHLHMSSESCEGGLGAMERETRISMEMMSGVLG